MSSVNIVLGVMSPTNSQRICDIMALTNMSEATVEYIIKELIKGGLVEEVTYNSYKKTREKKYKSKQQKLL